MEVVYCLLGKPHHILRLRAITGEIELALHTVRTVKLDHPYKMGEVELNMFRLQLADGQQVNYSQSVTRPEPVPGLEIEGEISSNKYGKVLRRGRSVSMQSATDDIRVLTERIDKVERDMMAMFTQLRNELRQ